jgi:hypothetical protein
VYFLNCPANLVVAFFNHRDIEIHGRETIFLCAFNCNWIKKGEPPRVKIVTPILKKYEKEIAVFFFSGVS